MAFCMNHMVACCRSAEALLQRRDEGLHRLVAGVLLAEGATSLKKAIMARPPSFAELAADEVHGLDAVGALVDHGDAGIAHELRHAPFLDVAMAAEHLLRLDGVVEAEIGEHALHDRRHQAHMVVRRLPLAPRRRSGGRCRSCSAVQSTSARAASLKALIDRSVRRTSGCTMIGSAGLSGNFAPVSARPCRRSFA